MKIGYIGCGNMGGALIRANVKAVSPADILICGKGASRAETLSQETGVTVSTPEEISRTCTYIFLGVKPQYMAETLAGVKPVLQARHDRFILVTMAAGLTMNRIREMAGVDCPVIRIMPNLAASVGESMTLWCADATSAEENACFLDFMRESGKFAEIAENLIDAGSAISGCGPAYAFLFMEALADGGVRCGLKRDTAMLLASQMLLGAAKLLQDTGSHPGALKDAVCSPGGTTIAGVLALEDGAFRSDCAKAVLAAYNRTLELK